VTINVTVKLRHKILLAFPLVSIPVGGDKAEEGCGAVGVAPTSLPWSLDLQVWAAGGIPLERYVNGSEEWERVLPATQDHLLQVISAGGSGQFTLPVEISALP
jgi:hypothetical protein